MKSVGLIPNPASGKDIRRLIAHGSVFDNQEKVRMVRRILRGLRATGVEEVLYMPDVFGIVERAIEGLEAHEYPPTMTPLDFYLYNSQRDSIFAAETMEKAGVGLIIVMGGDGTSRAVMKAARKTAILPLSTGTNNVFPIMVEATVAGLAAGVLASAKVSLEEGCYAASYLDILVDEEAVDIALVDAAVYRGFFQGSRAVWDIEDVTQIVVSRCRPDSIGLSAIPGQLAKILPESPEGFAVKLNKDAPCKVMCAIGPGLFSSVGIEEGKRLHPGESVPVEMSPCIIAVDGEREVNVLTGHTSAIRLANNTIYVVDVEKTLECARKKGVFLHGCFPCIDS